jgi:hypothetical protein
MSERLGVKDRIDVAGVNAEGRWGVAGIHG